jgi:hypothetical protein
MTTYLGGDGGAPPAGEDGIAYLLVNEEAFQDGQLERGKWWRGILR